VTVTDKLESELRRNRQNIVKCRSDYQCDDTCHDTNTLANTCVWDMTTTTGTL
jgi:hypothetical protein